MMTIYRNGKVYTGRGGFAEAFAEEDGRFVYAGNNAGAEQLEGRRVDLNGAFVCAGFTESHMHIMNYGQSLMEADLAAHTGSLEDMLKCLSDFEKSKPHDADSWLIGRGFNQDYFSDVNRLPSRWDLDRVSSTVPIMAERCCGHTLTVNSRALELLGLDADVTQPEGGRIGIENGVPDGRFYDNAIETVVSLIPKTTRSEAVQMVLAATEKLNSYGITSAHSDDYQSLSGIDWRIAKSIYEELEAEGKMTVRVYEQSRFSDPDDLRAFLEEGNLTGRGSELFKTGPMKMIGDGSLGARTAFLAKPYADAPEERGFPCFSSGQLDELIGTANAAGMQVAIHAIGDASLDMVLDSIEKALETHPRADHRHGIVHCQITRPDQLQRIIDMKLHVYAQTIFLDYDSSIVEARVGRELASTSYSWKTLMNGGVSVSNGTDCPVERPIPMAGIQCAVTRKSLRGGEVYLPGQAFTVAEAIDSYTIRGAEAAFEEDFKGLIAPGYLADFVVLDADPFTSEPEMLGKIQVLETFLGGRSVFKRN